MQRLVPAKTMAAMDKKTIENFGLQSLILMETAGRDAALHIRKRYEKELFSERKSVLVLCGTGNNGGDGWVLARYLHNWGVTVSVLFCGDAEKLTPDSLANRNLYEKAKGKLILAQGKDLSPLDSLIGNTGLFVDALFGVGLDREIKGLYGELIRRVNRTEKPVVSLDLPSGVHADTGCVLGEAFSADLTLTFGFAKPGLFLEPGRSLCGECHVIDIGIPRLVSDSFPKDLFLASMSWAQKGIRKRNRHSHKGTYGHLLLVAGAPATRGAAVLAAKGALRAGCGRLTLAVPVTSLPLPGIPPEVMVKALPGDEEGFTPEALPPLAELLRGKTILAAGPGMGLNTSCDKVLDLLLASNLGLILDADCLTLLSKRDSFEKLLSEREAETVLTPHLGEMAGLLKKTVMEIERELIAIAVSFCKQTNVHLLLKGSVSISGNPDGICMVNSTGNAGMATGGSGDVLCGILAALMAQSCMTDIATPLAAFIHGMAADLLEKEKGPWGYLPSEVAESLPRVFSLLLEKEENFPHG